MAPPSKFFLNVATKSFGVEGYKVQHMGNAS